MRVVAHEGDGVIVHGQADAGAVRSQSDLRSSRHAESPYCLDGIVAGPHFVMHTSILPANE
jgi:hypothetical protein